MADDLVERQPLGAVENGREHFRRLTEHYAFEDDLHPLAGCSDFQELRDCFEALVQWQAEAAARAGEPT